MEKNYITISNTYQQYKLSLFLAKSSFVLKNSIKNLRNKKVKLDFARNQFNSSIVNQ